MIVEHAELSVTPGREAEFEAAFPRGREVLAEAEGFRWARLVRQIENPTGYLLLVGWETLEAHTIGFRGSELFPRWRGIVGPFFAAPPNVVHYDGDLTPRDTADGAAHETTRDVPHEG